MSKTSIRGALLSLLLLPALAMPTAAQAAEPTGVGFVYVSPIGEAGWTYQHDLARKEMEKALGAQVKTKVVENVEDKGADAERVIRDLAQQGNKLVITTSFGYMNPTIKVAKQFPNTKFIHLTGYKTAPNVAVVNARFYEARYLAGVLAGKMSKTHMAGMVVAFPIPEVIQGINAFTRGMRSVDPKAEVKVIYVNSWYDPGKERDAANTLMEQGADVLTHHTDSEAVMQAAEEKGKMVISYNSDEKKWAPHAQLAAQSDHWGAYYTQAVKEVIAGTWKSTKLWGGLKEGFVVFDDYGSQVPAEVKAYVETQKKEIIAGKLTPFDGQIKDNEGKVRQEKGAMGDEALEKMDYYVDGVSGKMPGK
ncbi:MAG: BMP family ABC transporter substrate-binding protein [Burkholderiaceae bacterium]|nr:BMP family ABC transporter substrate-binding protein [Burkholderiaceae bacterium]